MKLVISDPKSGKAYSHATEETVFVGKKMGEVVNLDGVGLTGFEARITGGSDLQGFPMHNSVSGQTRKRILTRKGVGFKSKRKGERRRVSVRGNTIGIQISQINLAITKQGTKKIEEILGKKEETSEKEDVSAKEKALKKSKELAGKDIGDAPTKKARH